MPTITCEVCGDPQQVAPHRLRGKYPARFCSPACTTIARNTGLIAHHQTRNARKKYHWEPWMLDLLQRHYDGSPRMIDWLQARLPMPRSSIKAKAGALGLTRQQGRPWTPAEVTYLKDHLSTMAVPRLAAKLGRTVVAVKLKAKRVHATKSIEDGYTLRALEQCLGWDPHKTRRFITLGLLPAQRRQTQRTPQQGGDMWLIRDKALKQFIITYPEHVDLRRVDKDFLLDLLTDGAVMRAQLRRITAQLHGAD